MTDTWRSPLKSVQIRPISVICVPLNTTLNSSFIILNSSFKRGEAPLNYHFVTFDTMYFLIAENRFVGNGEQVECKGRLPNLLINSDTDR